MQQEIKGKASVRWPAKSEISRSSGRSTLVLFLHPQCPCSQASINEFAELVLRYDGKLDAHVIFFKPEDAPDDWVRTALWQAAIKIPKVMPHIDAGNLEADTFGVKTSGHALLFDVDGKLLFSGGITDGRGKANESEGRRNLLSLLRGGELKNASTPVFGCSLY